MLKQSVIYIAVTEDRHQNIMNSVALREEAEEPWTLERVTKFIKLLGYCEITLKSDTEPADTWNHPNHQMSHLKKHTRTTQRRITYSAVFGEHAGCTLS